MSNRKKSFTGQILDFILNDNNFNKKNSIILVLILGIIGVAGALFLTNFNYNEDDLGGYEFYDKEYNTRVLEEFGYSKVEIEEMDEETLKSLGNSILIKTRNQVAGNPHDGEYSYEKSVETKNRFYQYALAGDYESIIDEYHKIKSSNYLSEPYNQKLIRIYNDAYIINASLNDKYNTPMQIDTLSKLNDERMMLIMLISSGIETRNAILKDRLSLTFGKEDRTMKINSVSSSSMRYNARNNLYKQDVKMEKMLNYINEGDYIVYKVNFNLNEEMFNAYMYKDCNNMIVSIYGIYPDTNYNKSTDYITVAESAEILSNMENYNNSLNQNNNYINESIPTDDLLENPSEIVGNNDNSNEEESVTEDFTENNEDIYTSVYDEDDTSYLDGI